MNETPERICEALEWLTGHKWADNGIKNGKPSFACSDGDQTFSWDSEDGYCLHRGWFKRDIEEEFAYALAVTAPWEWNGCCAKLPAHNGEAGVGRDQSFDRYTWYLSLTDGPNMEEFEQTRSDAKSAARAAYLTWMRGRFAMKGCMA